MTHDDPLCSAMHHSTCTYYLNALLRLPVQQGFGSDLHLLAKVLVNYGLPTSIGNLDGTFYFTRVASIRFEFRTQLRRLGYFPALAPHQEYELRHVDLIAQIVGLNLIIGAPSQHREFLSWTTRLCQGSLVAGYAGSSFPSYVEAQLATGMIDLDRSRLLAESYERRALYHISYPPLGTLAHVDRVRVLFDLEGALAASERPVYQTLCDLCP